MVNMEGKSPENILDDNQKLIFFLVLFFKDFTFDKELLLNFNLTKSQIQEASEFFSHFGFLLLRQFSDLDELVQEALFKTIADPHKFYNQNPKVYILSEKGKEFAYDFIDKIKDKTQENVFFQDLFNLVKQKTQSFLTVKKKLEEEESYVLTRKVTYPNGVLLEKPTIKSREIKKAIELVRDEQAQRIANFKKDLLSSKQRKGITLSETEQKALVLANKGSLVEYHRDNRNIVKNSISYSGIFSHLPKTQVLKLAEGLQDSEVKLADKKFGKNGNKWQVDSNINYWSENLEKATFACFGAQGHSQGGVLDDDEFEELLEEYLLEINSDKKEEKNIEVPKQQPITKDNIFEVLGIDEELK